MYKKENKISMIFFLIHCQDHRPFFIIIKKNPRKSFESKAPLFRKKYHKNQNFFPATQFGIIKEANGKHVYVPVEEQLQ